MFCFTTNGWTSFCAFSNRFGMWRMMIGLAINNSRSLGYQGCVCQTGSKSIIVWTWSCTISSKTLGIKEKEGNAYRICPNGTDQFCYIASTLLLCLVFKKDNFLDDRIDVMQTDLSGDEQTETWFFERLEDTVFNLRSPCCFVTPNLSPCLEHWDDIRLEELCSFSTKLPWSLLIELSLFDFMCPPFSIDRKLLFSCLFGSELIWLILTW